ncbi:hypothetical protein [Desulfosporosinus fructosivorans]|uniref:hypothetical protein n=1 Tax=Desulfosporosinus fructosivorans TaxID=2018669 RepID=UPI00130E5369|nr:hypothetical protein [Desulfosporosinus fructosivorans]
MPLPSMAHSTLDKSWVVALVVLMRSRPRMLKVYLAMTNRAFEVSTPPKMVWARDG